MALHAVLWLLNYALFLKRLQVPQCRFPVELANVVCLNGRKSTYRPAEMHEMRFDWCVQRMHADFVREAVRLARVAATARRDDVGPRVQSAARHRNEVITCERFAQFEIGGLSPAILTLVIVAREQKGVRYLAAEAARHVDKARESNDGRARVRLPLRSHRTFTFSLDDFRFAVDDQSKRAPERHHRKWFVGRI
jgi:hypothetical protein